MSDTDFGWEELTNAWREAKRPPFDSEEFQSILRSRTHATVLVVLGELAVTAGLVWVTIWLSGAATVGADAIFLAGLWLFWTVATVFAWWNRRGQWRRSVASPEEFVRLSLDRAERKVRVVWFSTGLLVAQIAFVVSVWVFGRSSGGSSEGFATMLMALVGLVAAYSGWGVWYSRRARREREHFAALLRQMEAAGVGHTA